MPQAIVSVPSVGMLDGVHLREVFDGDNGVGHLMEMEMGDGRRWEMGDGRWEMGRSQPRLEERQEG